MKIIFKKDHKEQLEGHYAHYRHIKINSGGIYCDIRSFIVSHQEEWLKEIEDWYSELSKFGVQNCQYWWMNPGTRFHVWAPPIFKPLVFAVSVINFCKENNIERITLIACPKECIDCFREIAPDILIVEDGVFNEVFKQSILKRRVIRFKVYLGLFVKNWKNFFIKAPNFRGIKRIIYSHIVDGEIAPDRPDHFFGHMLDRLKDLNNSETLWLYFAPNVSQKIKNPFLKSLQKKNFLLVHDLLNPLDVIKLIYLCERNRRQVKKLISRIPPFRLSKFTSETYGKRYFDFLLNECLPLEEFYINLAIKKLLLKLPDVSKILFPYEEKALEKALQAGVESKGIQTIGYSHSIHNNLHLYFRKRKVPEANAPRPQIFAVTGIAEKEWLKINGGHSPESIHVVGSSRYILPVEPISDCGNGKLRILILVGQSYELNVLANFIEDEPRLFDNSEVIIRKYPFGWLGEQEEGIARIKAHVPNLLVENQTSMENQISWCHVALYNSTSTGIIAMLAKRLVIYVELHDIFKLDPMSNKYAEGDLLTSSNALQLQDLLNLIRKMSVLEYEEKAQKQREIALRVYSPPDEKELVNLLK